MLDGAYGLSSGLKYIPGAYSETKEVIELARVAGEYDGIYISHMREEGLDLIKSVKETIRIGEEGGLPAQVTHHKVMGVKHVLVNGEIVLRDGEITGKRPGRSLRSGSYSGKE